MSVLTRRGMGRPILSRDQIIGRDRGQGKKLVFPVELTTMQDYQPFSSDGSMYTMVWYGVVWYGIYSAESDD